MARKGKLPRPLFVFPADADEGERFFAEAWPEARAVSDPEGKLYEKFGISRASLRELFGPGVWLKAIQARKKGYRMGKALGSPWLMPGMFLLREQEVRWTWSYSHIGDHPDFETLSEFVE